MRTQQQPIDRALLTISSIVNTLAVSRTRSNPKGLGRSLPRTMPYSPRRRHSRRRFSRVSRAGRIRPTSTTTLTRFTTTSSRGTTPRCQAATLPPSWEPTSPPATSVRTSPSSPVASPATSRASNGDRGEERHRAHHQRGAGPAGGHAAVEAARVQHLLRHRGVPVVLRRLLQGRQPPVLLE